MHRNLFIVLILLLSVNIFSKQQIIEKNTAGIGLVYIAPGSFTIGAGDSGRDYYPPRSVTLTRGFWIGKYEITQKQYRDVTGVNPCEKGKYGDGDSLPVYNISWYDAVEFCNRLSEKNGLKPYYFIKKSNSDGDNISTNDDVKWRVTVDESANGFRLPTEAQWEYSCRAGSKTAYYWGKSASWDVAAKYSWHMFNAGQKRYSEGRFWWVKYHKVKKTGTKAPNRFGLHDMNGNVSEWCYDRYAGGYKNISEKDPVTDSGDYIYRVARGGSMLDSPKDFEIYRRWPVEPFERVGMNGLRVVLPE